MYFQSRLFRVIIEYRYIFRLNQQVRKKYTFSKIFRHNRRVPKKVYFGIKGVLSSDITGNRKIVVVTIS